MYNSRLSAWSGCLIVRKFLFSNPLLQLKLLVLVLAPWKKSGVGKPTNLEQLWLTPTLVIVNYILLVIA